MGNIAVPINLFIKKELKMRPLQTDLSIFEKFKFEKPPVAVKFLYFKPEGVKQIDKSLAFCEMAKEAQQRGAPFYFTKENEDCFGTVPLGMEDIPPWGEGGELGEKFEIFQEPRANARVYQYVPKFPLGTVNYVVFSTLDKLTFEPDVLILTATPSQAEIVLRAMAYSTGEIYESRHAGVLGCAWMFIYPYRSGKINFMVTGLTFGAKAHEVFPEGWILISIPYNWIPIITQNLKEMKWVLPSYTDGREKFLKRMHGYLGELAQASQNP
jgi:uncharacterized protein (DUF169 family)